MQRVDQNNCSLDKNLAYCTLLRLKKTVLFCVINGLTINFNFRYIDANLTDKLLTPLTFLSNGLTINVVNILVNGAHLCPIPPCCYLVYCAKMP